MKKIWFILTIFIVLSSSYTFSQNNIGFPIASQIFYDRLDDRSFNLNFQSNGVRAAGMGGAYLAIAKDPTALLINPAGMTQLQNFCLSIQGQFSLDAREYQEPKNVGMKIISEIDPHFSLNSLSVAYPISKWNRQFVVGLSYRNLSQQTNRIDDTHYGYGGGRISELKDINGGSYTISPSFAVEMIPKFAIGVTENFIVGKSTYDLKLRSPYADKTLYFQFKDKEKYAGSFIDFALLVAPFKWLSGGMIFTPSWKYSVEEQSEAITEAQFSLERGWSYTTINTPEEQLDKFELDIPASYGIGIALNPFSLLTFSFDYRNTLWSETKVTVNDRDVSYDFEDVQSYHTGLEYRVNFGRWKVPMRLGYYFSPRPNKDDWFNNIYEGDQIEYEAFTLGFGIYAGPVEVDFAYEHGESEQNWWKDIGDYFNHRSFMTTDKLNRINFSLSYKLNF